MSVATALATRAEPTGPPVPQANNIEIIATVVDAIAGGADTTNAIADAIGMVDRQGGYYPNAAAGLDLVRPIGTPRTWVLTDAGEAFLQMTAAERVADLRARIEGLPEIQGLRCDPTGATLADSWELSGATAQRRLTCLHSWAAFLTNAPHTQENMVAEALSATRTRTPEVVARHERLKAQQRAKEQTAKRPTCPSCFLPIPPALDACDTCS